MTVAFLSSFLRLDCPITCHENNLPWSFRRKQIAVKRILSKSNNADLNAFLKVRPQEFEKNLPLVLTNKLIRKRENKREIFSNFVTFSQ